jgi:DNA (cytosine-5)-methyltransferase 1
VSLDRKLVKVIELFAGGGGFRLGLPPDAEIVLAVEIDPEIATVYARNFDPQNLRVDDITNIDFTPYKGVDLIVGGPPCQDYSVANNKGDRTSDRSQLGMQMLRAIEEANPKTFILENVRNFGASQVWAKFQKRCLALGYKVACGVLKAADYGVPQSRKRFIAVGTLDKKPPQLPFPTHDKEGGFLFKHWEGWWDAIADLKIPKQDLAPFQQNAMSGNLRQKILKGAIVLIPRVGFNPKDGLFHRDKWEPAFTVRAFGHKRGHWAKFNVVTSEASYLASPRCLARWQTFPDSYVLPDNSLLAGKAIGNAIPPLLAKAIFDANFK